MKTDTFEWGIVDFGDIQAVPKEKIGKMSFVLLLGNLKVPFLYASNLSGANTLLAITESGKNIKYAGISYIIGNYNFTSKELFLPSINYSICIEPVIKAENFTCFLPVVLNPDQDFEVVVVASFGDFSLGPKTVKFTRPSSSGLSVGLATVSLLLLLGIGVMGYFFFIKRVRLHTPTAKAGTNSF